MRAIKKTRNKSRNTRAHLKITQIAGSAYNSVRPVRADSSYVLESCESAVGAQRVGGDENTWQAIV